MQLGKIATRNCHRKASSSTASLAGRQIHSIQTSALFYLCKRKVKKAENRQEEAEEEEEEEEAHEKTLCGQAMGISMT